MRPLPKDEVPGPALRWHGGKWMLAPWIIGYFPPHRVYTEAFGGAASVLLRKPRSYAEVYNDLDGDAVNLFRVLRRRENAARLGELLALTPYAREEFELAYEATSDDVERARRLVVRSFAGHGSDAPNIATRTGFRANSNRSGSIPAHDWNRYPERLAKLAERLKGVVVEHRPASDVIAAHDADDTLHYVDPPYVHSTRSGKMRYGERSHGYAHELSDVDHVHLIDLLRKVKGAVVLSGYPSTLYDLLLDDWTQVRRPALADGARPREEVLWLNPAAAERAL